MHPPPESETGEPIRLLRDQEAETSPDFLRRIRGKIHRRTTAAQFASFSWHLPKAVMQEMLGLVGYFAKVLGTTKESER